MCFQDFVWSTPQTVFQKLVKFISGYLENLENRCAYLLRKSEETNDTVTLKFWSVYDLPGDLGSLKKGGCDDLEPVRSSVKSEDR